MNENKNYITGILGALVGGFIASIPWILTYVYANMILSILAVIIAMGALKGYQMCNGKVDKSLPIIISIVSLICVTVSTLVIIPALLIAKEGAAICMENFNILYSSKEFVGAIMADYAISVLFTILGISGIIANIKQQLNEGKTENIKANLKNNKQEEATIVEEKNDEEEEEEEEKTPEESEEENKESEAKEESKVTKKAAPKKSTKSSSNKTSTSKSTAKKSTTKKKSSQSNKKEDK